jgi:hypothetical protein
MSTSIQKLPPAFQTEVYARISHAYGRARDAGLGQANLTKNLTLLNDALIEVTNDVSTANKLIALFRGATAPSEAAVQETFAKFSAQAQAQVKAVLSQVQGDMTRAMAVFKDFDPSAEAAKGQVKVGPAIKVPYLELLTAYGQIQEKMAADVAKLPVKFQEEVFARLSVQGQYERVRDVSAGQANLTKNLTVLNDVLIEVTTDVSTANHVARGTPEATLEKFSPTAQGQIQFVMQQQKGMSFQDAVAFVFKGFDPRQQAASSVQVRVKEHKGQKQVEDRRLPPPSSQRDTGGLGLPPPVVTRLVPPPSDETRRDTGTGAGGRGLAHMVSSEGANRFTAPVDSTNAVYEF